MMMQSAINGMQLFGPRTAEASEPQMFISCDADNIVVAEPWDRPDAALLDRFSGLAASIVGDVLDRMTALDGGIRLWTARDQLVGFALPVDVPAGDNLAIHRALDEARRGDVLVV